MSVQLDTAMSQSASKQLLDATSDNRQRLWGDDTTGRICAAAIRIFCERGYHAATMRDIAEAVGIRAPSIYNHFPNKEALLYFVMSATQNSLRDRVEAALAETANQPEERISAFVHEHICFHITYAAEAAVADNELRALSRHKRASMIAMRDRYEGILRDVLKAGIDQGVFVEGDLRLTSIAVLTMCTAVATWYRANGPLSLGQVAAAYTHFVLRLVGADG